MATTGNTTTSRIASAAAAVAVLQAMTSALAPRQRLGNQHAALLEKDFRAVAVGQEARVGKVAKVLPRQSTAQGMQHRQATEARVEDSDGVVIHWLIRSGIDSRFLGTKSAIDLSHTPGAWKVDL